jgi:hypothetical protein
MTTEPAGQGEMSEKRQPPRCDRCGSADDVQPMVYQCSGREPKAEMLCAGHRRSILKLAATVALFAPIRTVT